MSFVYSENIVAMLKFHVITKSRGSSIKEVVHGISFINHPAICDVGKT
jgi:hypothetical protein